MSEREPLLRIVDLTTEVVRNRSVLTPVDRISFTVGRGESVGIVGESGSGKTMTCLSVMRLLPKRSTRVASGRVWFDGVDLLSLSEKAMRAYRGRRIAMIMQDSLSAFNPVLTIGDQVTEPARHHLQMSLRSSRERGVGLMRALAIPRAEDRLGNYPHQFSGGTLQRHAAAMGLIASPDLIIADEPTTALDVTTQAQFLTLVRELQQERGVAVVWITHDLGVTAQVCDRVNVMYAGRIVESGTVRRVLKRPLHPYTQALVRAVPAVGEKQRRLYQIPGQAPDLGAPWTGCAFASRCPVALGVCREQAPPMRDDGEGGHVACWAVA